MPWFLFHLSLIKPKHTMFIKKRFVAKCRCFDVDLKFC